MRFCFVTTFYPPYSFGGDANFVRNLALELAGRGHAVEIVHCLDSYRALQKDGDFPQVHSGDAGITVHGIESGWGAISPLATHQTGLPLFKTRALQRILDQPFDVIHYHNISLVGGPGVLRFGRAVKLYTWHEYWLVCPTHLLMRDGREPCVQRRCWSCCLRQRRPIQWWRPTDLLSRSLRCVDTFLSPSRFAISQHRELNLRAPVVHLPLFVPKFETIPRTVPSDPYFLYVGRLEYSKGPRTLIAPFLRWNRCKLIIAGTGPEQTKLEQSAASSSRIAFTGHLPLERLRELYRNAIAVIVPSLTYELFPLVILEAFREGTPVIVRKRGSLPEIVADSGAGLIYDSDDELIRQAERLASDAAFRDEMGARALNASENLWSADIHVGRYLEIVESLQTARPRVEPFS